MRRDLEQNTFQLSNSFVEAVTGKEPSSERNPLLPPSYHQELSDDHPLNDKVYRGYYSQISLLMNDSKLTPIEKIVMVAYYTLGLETSDQEVCKGCGITFGQLYQAQAQLMATTWLPSVEEMDSEVPNSSDTDIKPFEGGDSQMPH